MNRLAGADSLYLRQHAADPVDWWPWCDEALAEARRHDRPVLLSIGYAACHWCHVMAHESFGDAEVAAEMNAHFLCIKLDREQRPDLDQAYQRAQFLLNDRAGGWPLTAFLDPQTLLPIFIGTYFPPRPRHGLPAFRQVLAAIAAAWRDQRDAISRQVRQWQDGLARELSSAGAANADADPMPLAMEQFAAQFDSNHGGHRGAPKFPRCTELELWLDLVADDAPDAATARVMVQTTLDAMARGGLRDQLDGGFFRYCVDDDWTIPHFEKMLYDNAQMIPLYAGAARLMDRMDYEHVARACAHWVQSTLALPQGLWASSLDADSPGGEGAYYVWTPALVAAALPGANEVAVASRRFGFDRPFNFEGRAWHLRIPPDARLQGDSTESAVGGALLRARSERPPPARDDKALTGWNALAIAGALRAARMLDDAALAAPARSALDALRDMAWRNGVLVAQADSTSGMRAFLDDHAYLLDALLQSLGLQWRDADLVWATSLAQALGEHFEDAERGGFFFSAPEHQAPMGRQRGFEDTSQPSGNAVAATALMQLGHLRGESRWMDVARRALSAGLSSLGSHPAAGATLLRAWRHLQHPPPQIIVRAAPSDLGDWQDAVRRLPRGFECYVIPDGAADLPPTLAARAYEPGGVAYWCEGFTCRAPITHPRELQAGLRNRASGALPADAAR